MRKLAISVLGLLLVLGALLIVISGVQKGKGLAANAQTTTPQTVTTVPAPTVSTAPTVTTTTTPQAAIQQPPASGQTGQPPKLKPDEQEAVSAAITASTNISAAVFLPANEMRSVVRQLVVPSQQSQVAQSLAQEGPALATDFGYDSVQQAQVNNNANYYVSVLLYRVMRFTDTQATVNLYSITNYVTAKNLQYMVPGISVIKLEKHGNKWLYVETDDPPASQAPSPINGLSLQATEKRFQPYLKGYKTYVETDR